MNDQSTHFTPAKMPNIWSGFDWTGFRCRQCSTGIYDRLYIGVNDDLYVTGFRCRNEDCFHRVQDDEIEPDLDEEPIVTTDSE